MNDPLWCVDSMKCDLCGYEWIGVHPCAETLECARCGHKTKSGWAEDRDEWIEREMGENTR